MIILCCVSVGFTSPTDKFEQRLGKKYFLKHNLILFDRPPKIFPDNIIFTEGCNGRLSDIWQVMYMGIELEITSMERADKFLKLSIKTQKDSFQVLLANRSRRELERSFDLVFAEKWAEREGDIGCGGYETKLQAIKCLGFPIFACKKGRTERLFYIPQYAEGRLLGYDECWIEIKDGKVVNIAGII